MIELGTERRPIARVFKFCRSSTVPYISVLLVGGVIAAYMQYVWQYFIPEIPVIKAQPPGIWISAVAFTVAGALWVYAPSQRMRGRLLSIFLGSLIAAWMIHIALMRLHGDAFYYTAFLYPVIVAMLWTKSPSAGQARSALVVLGWAGSLLLVWTRGSELLGILPMAPVPAELVAFEVGEYWLPLSGILGPEGRWPGPLGGTAYTGMLGAMLLVIAVVVRRRSSWLFGIVGVLALLLTSSRGAIAAAVAGIGIAMLFSNGRILRGVTFRWRFVAVCLSGAFTLALLIRSNPGLTGRTTFWTDFVALWQTSPITGVGLSGYLQGTNWTKTAGSAHSLFIDELARNGILGLTVVGLTLITALALGLQAARRRESGPLALIATFVVLGVVNTPIDWLGTPPLWWALVLATLWAASRKAPGF